MKTNPDFPIFQNPESDGKSFNWSGTSETGIVCFHGFTATTVEVRKFAESLHQAGYSVSGPLLPGHGESPESLNKVTWKDWFQTAENAYLQMQDECRNVFLAGESTGALLSILLAAKYPQIKGLLLFSPALVIHGIWLSRLIWPFKDYKFKKNINLASPWQGYNVIPIHAASELSKLQSQARRTLNHVTVPVIVFQGKLDKTIDPMSSEIVLEKIASSDKELVWLANSPHVILLEGPFYDVLELSLNFVTSRS